MPYMHRGAFTRILDWLKDEGKSVTDIVQVGDLYDLFSFSKYPRSLNVGTPKDEILQGRAMAEEFWRLLQKRCPKATCYQLLGNHDERPAKRILEKAPELEALIDIKHLWEFKGVKTIHDPREELMLDGIYFQHGFRSKLGDHAKFNQASTVCGHSHVGGVVFFPLRDKILFELNAGYLAGDEEPMRYTRQSLTRWTHGFGIIDALGPRFVPIKV